MLDELPTKKWGICHLNVSKESFLVLLEIKTSKNKKRSHHWRGDENQWWLKWCQMKGAGENGANSKLVENIHMQTQEPKCDGGLYGKLASFFPSDWEVKLAIKACPCLE